MCVCGGVCVVNVNAFHTFILFCSLYFITYSTYTELLLSIFYYTDIYDFVSVCAVCVCGYLLKK